MRLESLPGVGEDLSLVVRDHPVLSVASGTRGVHGKRRDPGPVQAADSMGSPRALRTSFHSDSSSGLKPVLDWADT